MNRLWLRMRDTIFEDATVSPPPTVAHVTDRSIPRKGTREERKEAANTDEQKAYRADPFLIIQHSSSQRAT